MNRRTFLKSFGFGLAAMVNNFSLSKSAIRNEVRRVFASMVENDAVTDYNWYIDSVGGSDANDGFSSLTPLKTLAKLTTKPITAGQKVGIKSGSVFRETLTIPSSGTAGNPITYQSYGSGAMPRILGSNALTNWTQTDIPSATADIISEDFETTKPAQNGYDTSTWTEHIGGGCIVDPDNADVPRPDGSNQVLKIQKVSPNYDAVTERDLGTENPVCFTNIYIYIATEGLSSEDSVNLVREQAAFSADVMCVYLNKSGTQLRFALTVFNNGVADYTYYNINLGQWYLVSLKYDYPNKTYEICINGVPRSSGVLTGVLQPGIRILSIGDNDHAKTLTAYFDALKISSTNYPTAAVPLPANCYKSRMGGLPRELYFEQVSGKIRRGLKQTTITACNDEFEWYYHINGYVVLCAPSDPGSRYTAVEAGVRKNCITHNNQRYITIDGLEVAYSVQDTVSVASNWIVQYCNSHHASRATTINGGDFGGIYGDNASNCVVRYCTIHGHPCKGIQFDASNGASISGNLIEHNIFYDNSDFSVDCQVFTSGIAHTGLIIQYNEFYTTADWESNRTGANGIYTSGHPGYPMVGPIVRYNLFHDMGGNGVQVGPNVNGMLVYNNTFARTLSGYSDVSNAIYTSPTAGSCTIKNNIGYGFNYQMYIPDKSRVTEVDYNCWYKPNGNFIFVELTTYYKGDFAAYQAATGWDTHGIWADPLFISESDLRLQANSPCINAGVNLGIPQDFAGVSVGNPPEIGAYEFQPPAQPATIVLSDLYQIYDGNPKGVNASTTPPGLAISILYTGISDPTYSQSNQAPINAGSYKVDTTIIAPNYYGSATGTLVIAKANATIILNNLIQAYDGNPKSVSATTTPPALGVSLTYSGINGTTYGPSTTAPSQVGAYQVDASIINPNYQGSASGILTIVTVLRKDFLPLIVR